MLKPFFCRRLKDRYTCCCEHHVQMSFLKDTLNHMRSRAFGLHDTGCNCECSICATGENISRGCLASQHTFKGVTQMWESVLCPKPADAVFYRRECLMGDCKICGVKRLKLCCLETAKPGKSIIVKLFAYVESKDKHGNSKKRKDLVHKEMQCWEFIQLLKTKLKLFITHNYVAQWQGQQFKDCLLRFPDDVVVSVVDFAENYAFKEQNEIQSMHWYSSQVTIFVHITYYRKAGEVVKVIHFFISDDKVHDTLFVQHCFMLHRDWLQQEGVTPKQHWVWSDGAASQFKGARPFYFVARYGGLTGIRMSWFFFGSGHGKGKHDGAGAVVKRTLTHEQLKPNGATLKCAADVVAYCQATMSQGAPASYPSKERECARVFWEVKEGDVNREFKWNCDTVEKTRSLHAFRGHNLQDPTALATRNLACFCDACTHGRWIRCINKAHVQAWDYHVLLPLDDEVGANSEPTEEVVGYDDFTYEGHHDVLSSALCVGDTFAVNPDAPTNGKNMDFYLVKCVAAKKQVEKGYIDEWTNVIDRGSYVVQGLYYKQLDAYTFKLDHKQSIVHLLSHLVRCIKIPMERIPKRRQLYTITPESYEAICNSMPFNF